MMAANPAIGNATRISYLPCSKCGGWPSDRDMLDALANMQRLLRRLVEVDALRQQQRGRAHALRLRADTGGFASFGQAASRLAQAPARQDDAAVGRDQMLARAILDRPHAFLDRRILHRDASDAG